VTDGARVCADIRDGRLIQVQPPEVTAKRITGAGDTFMAAHLAAELNGQDPETALAQAAQAAASFVAGEDL
ncbi:MAG: PfkB family carbohydrate kinase, partial [Mangrovicoccus sp.]